MSFVVIRADTSMEVIGCTAEEAMSALSAAVGGSLEMCKLPGSKKVWFACNANAVSECPELNPLAAAFLQKAGVSQKYVIL